MIAIVHTGLGNFRSVQNAFESMGFDARITDRAVDLDRATHIILPGVGTFVEGMRTLREKGLTGPLQREVLEKKKPFLGICLGMQLLASFGTEGGRTAGLDWISGFVDRLSSSDGCLRLPHVGWNEARPMSGSRLLSGLDHPTFYFVHSYFMSPQDPSVVSATCQYGTRFAAAVEKGNIAAVQFHPEKSQADGLRLLRNFMERFR